MTMLTLEERQRRKAHIESAENGNTAYTKRCRLHGYITGKAVLDLNECAGEGAFPATAQYDRLKRMAEGGVSLAVLRGYEGRTAYVKAFVELCHYFGIQAMPEVLVSFPLEVEARAALIEGLSALLLSAPYDGVCCKWVAPPADACEREIEDLLGILYTDVKRQGGIYILQCENGQVPAAKDPVCDLLWECDAGEDQSFAKTLPFLKFPLWQPQWGEGVPSSDCLKWQQYAACYQRMTKENSVAYVDLRESTAFAAPLPDGVHVSMFVNEAKYLAIANLSEAAQRISLSEAWTELESGCLAKEFTLKAGDVLLLSLR